jgi:DNA-3-methyladenine glycosylase I
MNNLCRCPWVDLSKSDYVAYHDEEWGVPVHDDRLLFEFLVLEGAQAGLSWYTVLRKRQHYRVAFDHFVPAKVARYDERKIAELLATPALSQRAKSGGGQQRPQLSCRAGGVQDWPTSAFVDGRPVVGCAPRRLSGNLRNPTH